MNVGLSDEKRSVADISTKDQLASTILYGDFVPSSEIQF